MQCKQIWVVTPSYNSMQWLACAVASVADQAGNNVTVHHHIQDGGSKDGTREWLEAYAEQCARKPQTGYTFSYESAPDGGMYEALNQGWSKAPQGVDILAHLNSDEQYLPGALQTVAEIFTKNPSWEVLLADLIVVDNKGRYLCHRRSLKPSPLIFRYTCGGMTASTFQRAYVFQKRQIGFEPEWRIAGDKVWYHTMLQAGVRIGHANRLVSVFTETGNNLGWSSAAREETQRYATRFLRGKTYGIYLFGKWNGLRRIVKEWCITPPKSYALYTHENLRQRQLFPIMHPTGSWGRKPGAPANKLAIWSLIDRFFSSNR